MTSFITVDYDQLTNMNMKCGYYQCCRIHDHIYRYVSDKFILTVELYGDTTYMSISISQLVIFITNVANSNEYIDIYDNNISESTRALLKQNLISNHEIDNKNTSDLFHGCVKSIIDVLKDVLMFLPSLEDIMSFLDLIPDKHSSEILIIKNMFTDPTKWKSGLELLINYNMSTMLCLPMVII